MIKVLFSTPVICAAPFVLPQSRRLSVTDLTASVAKGFDGGSVRSTTLWWISVIAMEEPGCIKADSDL